MLGLWARLKFRSLSVKIEVCDVRVQQPAQEPCGLFGEKSLKAVGFYGITKAKSLFFFFFFFPCAKSGIGHSRAEQELCCSGNVYMKLEFVCL